MKRIKLNILGKLFTSGSMEEVEINTFLHTVKGIAFKLDVDVEELPAPVTTPVASTVQMIERLKYNALAESQFDLQHKLNEALAHHDKCMKDAALQFNNQREQLEQLQHNYAVLSKNYDEAERRFQTERNSLQGDVRNVEHMLDAASSETNIKNQETIALAAKITTLEKDLEEKRQQANDYQALSRGHAALIKQRKSNQEHAAACDLLNVEMLKQVHGYILSGYSEKALNMIEAMQKVIASAP